MLAERDAAMRDFLAQAGWGNATLAPLPGDASTRRYVRARHNGREAMIMDQPQTAEAPAAPADASEAERQALGYNAVARLAGADCARFAAAAEFLRGRGLSAPEIYAADTANGFLLLEDLGDGLYADVIPAGASEKDLYANAVAALAKLHAEPAPSNLSGTIALHEYDLLALLAETDLLTQWFFPVALGRQAAEDEREEHRALWRDALAPITGGPGVFVHRDYHAQNLLWLGDRKEIARTGLIDFQDAVAGTRSYDLVSLLEDARRDVAPELAEAMTAHYIELVKAGGSDIDGQAHRAEMAVIAAQRNAKIVGIFARLFKRDGKPRYLAYLPRVWRYLDRDLSHPALARLRKWYDARISAEHRSAPPAEGATA